MRLCRFLAFWILNATLSSQALVSDEDFARYVQGHFSMRFSVRSVSATLECEIRVLMTDAAVSFVNDHVNLPDSLREPQIKVPPDIIEALRRRLDLLDAETKFLYVRDTAEWYALTLNDPLYRVYDKRFEAKKFVYEHESSGIAFIQYIFPPVRQVDYWVDSSVLAKIAPRDKPKFETQPDGIIRRLVDEYEAGEPMPEQIHPDHDTFFALFLEVIGKPVSR